MGLFEFLYICQFISYFIMAYFTNFTIYIPIHCLFTQVIFSKSTYLTCLTLCMICLHMQDEAGQCDSCTPSSHTLSCMHSTYDDCRSALQLYPPVNLRGEGGGSMMILFLSYLIYLIYLKTRVKMLSVFKKIQNKSKSFFRS